jgi:hypothetical protein
MLLAVQVLILAALAVQVLSLFDMQILLRRRHQPQDPQQLQSLVAIASIVGQDQGALHSDGTLCTN